MDSNAVQIVRYKYRPTAIQPEMTVQTDGEKIHKNRKKVKKVEEPLVFRDSSIDFAVPMMLPEHTQQMRVVKQVFSDEAKMRKARQPTIFQKIEAQKKWLETQEMELRRQALHQKMIDNMYEREHNLETADNEDDIDLNMDSKEQDVFGVLDEPGMEMDPHQISARECLLEIVAMKEKRFARARNTRRFYFAVKWSKRYKLALSLYFGMTGLSNRAGYTEILPWLVLGGADVASNMANMVAHSITHVMNATDELKSPYGDMFITIKFPIKDTANSDAAKFFDKALEFFARVQTCKGKVLVHCDTGMSRGPTMVLAYLVAGPPKLSLADAYNYVKARRPSILINRMYLTQLAELEIEQEQGCSVLFHNEWSYYEFNVIKSTKPDFRESHGIYHTALSLYGSKKESEQHPKH